MELKSNFNECPFCHSYNYEIGYFNGGSSNCHCKDCGATWHYTFNKF